MPYDLPEGWVWSRIGSIYWNEGQSKPISDFRYIDTKSVDNEKNILIDENISFLSPDEAPSRARKIVKHDSVLFSTVRPYLKNIALFSYKKSEEFIVSTAFIVLDTPINSEFLKYHLMYSGFMEQVELKSTGTSYPAINDKNFNSLFISISPFEEQVRISKIIKILFNQIDLIEKEQTELQELSKQLKQKVLDVAMQGKLITQDPNDEPASVLLDQIRQEKQKLYEEGKIKKKDLVETEIITDGKDYYEKLPLGWEITNLGNIGKWISGATPKRNKKEYYSKGTIPWLKTGDLKDSKIEYIPEKITQLALEETSVKLIPSNTVVMAMYGATIGKLGITTFETTSNQACCACLPYSKISVTYLFYFLLSKRNYFLNIAFGGAQPNISKVKIESTKFLLPPLSEQKRIINRIMILFQLIQKVC